ncbi:MAG: aminoglycoside phosphotransferase (APT) family kinase protein [Bradymonadia bacterium]|jgi:aminoglycoside phosphotransferase (APT) family kinase protein
MQLFESMQLSAPIWHRLIGAPLSLPTIHPLKTGRGISALLYVVRWGADQTAVLKISNAREDGARELKFLRTMRDSPDVPRLLGAVVEPARILLLIEDLRDATPGDMLIGATRGQALAAMDVLGRLHAGWWNAPPPDWSYKPPRWAGTTAAQRAQFVERYPHPWAQARLADLPDMAAQMAPVLAAIPPSLMHADAHLDNWMFRPAPILIDWESVRVGPAIVDVVRFLVEGLTSETRRQMQSALLERWRVAVSGVTAAVAAETVQTWVRAALWYTINAVVAHDGGVGAHTHSARMVQAHHQCVRQVMDMAADVLG